MVEDSGDVFPHDDVSRSPMSLSNIVNCIAQLREFDGEQAAGAGESCAPADHAEVLAWRPRDEDVGIGQFLRTQLGEVVGESCHQG